MSVPPEELYRRDERAVLHQGAICQFSPIPWFEPPPLWILRNIDWEQGVTELWQWESLGDAFRREERAENVILAAKVRTVIVLSNDAEARHSGLKEVAVAPVYTLDRQNPADYRFIDRLIKGELTDSYYLPRTHLLPEMGEAYINFRKIQPHRRDFLAPRKLNVSLSQAGVQELLNSYIRYLQISFTDTPGPRRG